MLFKLNKTTPPAEDTVKDVIESCLKKDQLRYRYEPEEERFYMNITGDRYSWHCLIYIDKKRKAVLIRSYYPFQSIDGKSLKIAELATRINERILFGRFQLDYERGIIMLDTPHLFADSSFTTQIFKTLFYSNMISTEQHFNLFAAVNFGDEEPVLLIQQFDSEQVNDDE